MRYLIFFTQLINFIFNLIFKGNLGRDKIFLSCDKLNKKEYNSVKVSEDIGNLVTTYGLKNIRLMIFLVEDGS